MYFPNNELEFILTEIDLHQKVNPVLNLPLRKCAYSSLISTKNAQ